MNTIMKRRSIKAGLPPGSLIYTGEKKSETIQIKLFNYTVDRFEEKVIDLNDVSLLHTEKSNVHWINVEGIHDVNTIEKLGRCFGIHSLVLEDILNTGQRPKIENYEGYTYIVVRMLFYDNELGEFTTEQESFILGENYVISFSERKIETYNTVREGIRQGVGRIRKMGADYLIYNLLDAIVDNYFVVLEELSEKIEDTEDELVSNPSKSTLQVIHKLKRQMLYLHKSVWPLREVVNSLARSETPLVKDSVDIYIRDLYDHVIQVMDTTETLRDILSSMLDMYLSSVSNKMNEIMKVLTIISTVFIPLSFIVGLYGMNLTNMPEYNWPWMYPVVWIIMISIATLMLIFFKKKKWW
ncbi:magnesium/cobalt transporter CorA [Clostridium uliginosum]|uniref:Magnesium transport protein CorA n=1 Tax=Clostridium uliginosum TaxID=119641 RepID=A0A1I1NSI6_9CLOT|nr:magnesium/cobalt transporter CorA [Clostridium uliginosum]SFC97733.1 magnesium transporter [Clostridium uliginosum]